MSLSPLDIKIGKIDCTNKETSSYCSGFKIEEYPTIKFSKDGRVYMFNNTRNEYNIIDFVKKDYLNSKNHPLPGHETIVDHITYYYNVFTATFWVIYLKFKIIVCLQNKF